MAPRTARLAHRKPSMQEKPPPGSIVVTLTEPTQPLMNPVAPSTTALLWRRQPGLYLTPTTTLGLENTTAVFKRTSLKMHM